MSELEIDVPTYNGNLSDPIARDALPEFGDPHIPVLIYRADGIRIVLGSSDYLDDNAPDIHIERRPQGWAIFLHPVPGGDPSGYVYFLDDGRSYVIPEHGSDAIRMVESGDEFAELDTLPKSDRQRP